MLRRKRRKQSVRTEFETIDELREYIRAAMRQCMEGKVPSGLPAAEREKYLVQIRQLRKALRACVYGEGGEKDYIKRYIMGELARIGLTTRETERLLPVHMPERLSPARKFDILLYLSMKQYGKDGFLRFCDQWKLPGEVRREDGSYFEITAEDIGRIY
ncbi:MAG: hypothetical protein ACI4QX_04690, partial [Lachnospiraceae bacterium]